MRLLSLSTGACAVDVVRRAAPDVLRAHVVRAQGLAVPTLLRSLKKRIVARRCGSCFTHSRVRSVQDTGTALQLLLLLLCLFRCGTLLRLVLCAAHVSAMTLTCRRTAGLP